MSNKEQHSKSGCRIGDRLDIVLGENTKMKEELEEINRGAEELFRVLTGVDKPRFATERERTIMESFAMMKKVLDAEISKLKERAEVAQEQLKNTEKILFDSLELKSEVQTRARELEAERDKAQLDAAHDHADNLKLQSTVSDLREALKPLVYYGNIHTVTGVVHPEFPSHYDAVKSASAALAKSEPKA